MQVIDNKALLVNTKFPERITGAITKSKVIKQDEDITRVLVNWEFEEAMKCLMERSVSYGKRLRMGRAVHPNGTSKDHSFFFVNYQKGVLF